ncbi:MAG: cytochrome C biogenesis protein CcmF [Rickettsiales bacterium]|nr:cytochrome C biogenesis protein CcmF [Rickettsiales bacterium]
MNSALGQGLILLSLATATVGCILGFAAGRSGSAAGLRWTRWLAGTYATSLILANLVMEYALLTHDFTVKYVDMVGSTSSPTYITIVSLWSSLEGSILFWGMILAIYIWGFLATTRQGHERMTPYTLATVLAVGTFFSFLIAGPADPFSAVQPRPDSMHTGPNPLLQNHWLMIIHPPALYLGYVGMTIPFGMGVSALLRGELGASWMALTRSWMLVPFGFLTAGVVLGGWWAYEVLGWGGYWAWDPVENASFLPWLTAAAFLHAAMLEERRGLLKAWTVVLLLVTFALTILGTFMTRSGVFNSVHSFTQSAIGPTFLVFLAVILVISVLLVGLRMHLLSDEGSLGSPLSRDAAFIVNNLLFAGFTFVVLVGTVFPLLAEAVRDIKLSVGAPFFNQLSVPIGLTIVFLMGVGPALPWGRTSGKEAASLLWVPLTTSLILGALALALGMRQLWPVVTLIVSLFAALVALRDMVTPVSALMRRRGLPPLAAASLAFRRGRRRYGGQIVHIGVALVVVSIAVSSSYQVIEEGMVPKGQSLTIADYELRFEESRSFREPHRDVLEAQFTVLQNGREVGSLGPRLNRYSGQMNPIGTPAVLSTARQDLYLSLMSVAKDGQAAGLRAFINPMVSWLWVGATVMVLGVLIAAWPRRRQKPATKAAA